MFTPTSVSDIENVFFYRKKLNWNIALNINFKYINFNVDLLHFLYKKN